MNNDNHGTPPKIDERFPKMKPIKGTPTLFRLNGCGVSVYGKRDYDAETNTYVKTHCITLVFIPVFAIGAYRVADAERGWYFIGKEPLSKFARGWNWAMTAMICVFAIMSGVTSYTSSPEYKAKQDLAAAGKRFNNGEVLQAAGAYSRVISSGYHIDEAREGMRKSIEQGLHNNSPHVVAGALRVARMAPRNAGEILPQPFERGLQLIEQFKQPEPSGALEIYDELVALQPTNAALPALHMEVLKLAIAKDPNNVDRVVELALLYEAQHNLKDCGDLLVPHRNKLGSTEGARMLGQLYLANGQYEDAYGLLFPFVQQRLTELRKVEAAYTNEVTRAYNRSLNNLRAGKADRDFYDRYKTAAKPEQAAMVNEYIAAEVKNDGALLRARAALRSAGKIINVTLDLGIVQLNRAQTLRDPAARKTELEAAEKTFLAIRGLAGETDDYRLFLGQVYYWLGRPTEGKELFDQLLASSKNKHAIVMRVLHTLRDVGERAAGRELAEKAYRDGNNAKEKYEAAEYRSLLYKDVDDEIAWLKKSDPEDVGTQINLERTQGDKALETGDKAAAALHLRKAVDAYGKLDKSAATLNNAGVTCLHLANATGAKEDSERGMALMEEAIALDPGNSLLVLNTTATLFEQALREVLSDGIDFGTLGQPAESQMLALLYTDDAGRKELYARLHDNSTLRKTLVYLDKAMLLSPKTEWLYTMQLTLQRGFRELPEIQKLQQRIRTAALDVTEAKTEWQEVTSGSKDKERRETIENGIKRCDAALLASAKSARPLTSEFLKAKRNSLQQALEVYVPQENPEALLADMLALREKHDDGITSAAVENAYLFVAHCELKKANADYAALAEKCRHVLSPADLLTLVLEADGPLSAVVRKNANVLKAAQEEKESAERFPSSPDVSDWALLRTIDATAAGRIAAVVKTNEVAMALAETSWALGPLNSDLVLKHYWHLKLRGEKQQAEDVYKEAIRQGVPLPTL